MIFGLGVFALSTLASPAENGDDVDFKFWSEVCPVEVTWTEKFLTRSRVKGCDDAN